MGIVLSTASTSKRNVDNVTSESVTMNETNRFHNEDSEENAIAIQEDRGKAKEEEMEEFNKHLTLKREQRKEILARHRAEKEQLDKSLQNERASKIELCESNRLLRELLLKNNIDIPENLQPTTEKSEIAIALDRMTEDFNNLKSCNNKLRRDLADTNKVLQEAYSDIADLNSQNRESMKQINALKEVVTVSKTMISLREQQLTDLKNKLDEIERTLGDRETNLLSADLRKEYARQLQNIRTLRGLYEERARLAEVTREGLARELEEHKILYEGEVKKCKDLDEKVEELEEKVDSLHEIIDSKNHQISLCQDETNGLKAEMTVVNKLFSEVLLGYKTKQDLDKLVLRLEENHGLLTQMAEREKGSEMSSALPKLLLELVSQVEENEQIEKSDSDNDTFKECETLGNTEGTHNSPSTTAEEIVENLPKVWKVLIELLSHQNVSDDNSSEKVTTCYKSVETNSGPVLVPSVSQTYIRLKDLIVEKLGLIKEVNRMKQLNTHLETRLEEQERRLTLVTNELSKTWHVVGRLRRHHQQLHTHEKILKYELQQKRKLLNELKEELEYCRDKWEQAREKNSQSERDWRKLRAEFTSRKTKLSSPSLNNSGESGYSDERPSDESSESNDESEYVAEPLMRCKKKLNSFETILDSSTDRNLVAEREDPASDMLDVADLPLDTQEGEDNRDKFDPSKSEHFQHNGKLSEETEDEIGDITHDEDCTENSCIDECPSRERIIVHNNEISTEDASKEALELDIKNITATTFEPCSSATSSQVTIFNNNEHQTEALNENVDHILERNKQSNNDQDNHTCRPTNRHDNQDQTDTKMDTSCKIEKNDEGFSQVNKNETVQSEILSTIGVELSQNTETAMEASSESAASEISKPEPDFKAILENVRKQNERLAKKDERLSNLENSCTEVVQNIKTTLNNSEKIIEKLDTLHNGDEKSNGAIITDNSSKEDNSVLNEEGTMPSTSAEIDHEARFAARDLRLKRLEEQTKSLVNKVNNTATKGVKINYKLEELHNIYGSENSRAGTPSEDNDDKNNDNETNNE